jgi:hypothetical protein
MDSLWGRHLDCRCLPSQGVGAPRVIRTPDRRISSPALYPLSYGGVGRDAGSPSTTPRPAISQAVLRRRHSRTLLSGLRTAHGHTFPKAPWAVRFYGGLSCYEKAAREPPVRGIVGPLRIALRAAMVRQLRRVRSLIGSAAFWKTLGSTFPLSGPPRHCGLAGDLRPLLSR